MRRCWDALKRRTGEADDTGRRPDEGRERGLAAVAKEQEGCAAAPRRKRAQIAPARLRVLREAMLRKCFAFRVRYSWALLKIKNEDVNEEG